MKSSHKKFKKKIKSDLIELIALHFEMSYYL